jgi:hypothetical protein
LRLCPGVLNIRKLEELRSDETRDSSEIVNVLSDVGRQRHARVAYHCIGFYLPGPHQLQLIRSEQCEVLRRSGFLRDCENDPLAIGQALGRLIAMALKSGLRAARRTSRSGVGYRYRYSPSAAAGRSMPIRRTRSAGCARAVSGDAAALPSPAINSRRLMRNPQGSKLARRELNFTTPQHLVC